MMLDPVDHSSDRLANLNSWVTHKITSSLSRERSTPICAQTYAASATPSRAAVPSIELGTLLEKPRSAATDSGSSPSDVPASAAEP